MNNIMNSFKNKKVRYGSFSTLMIVVVIAILVIINLVAGRLNLSYDMTANKLYSLSQESKDELAKLNEDVTIYALVRSGEENSMFSNAVGQMTFKQLLQEYVNSNSHISVVYKDPYLYPQFAVKYEDSGQSLPDSTVIIESAKRFRVINPNDMITTDYDQQTYQPYVKSIDIEPQITNAIDYVTADNTSIIYTFTNDGESPVADSLKSQITLANYDIKTFDVLTQDIPSDCAILLLTQPTRDWSETAATKVKAYLQNGGRALFAINYTFTDMPNLDSVLQAYGISLGKYVVVEGSQNNYVSSPLYLLPNIQQHDVNQKLLSGGYRVLLAQSSGIDTLSVKKNSIKIEPLLVTSSQAYGKVNVDNQTTIAKQEGDVDGPINVAVAVTDSFYTDVQHTTKLVFIASGSVTDDQVNGVTNGANYLLLVSSLNWLQDKSDTVYIPSKTPNAATQLTISQVQVNSLMFVSIFVIPLAIIVIGLVVWLRRRYS